MPEGTYWSEALDRYVLPHETDVWRPEEYERVTGQKLPQCPCGNDGAFVLFMSAYKVGAEEGQGQVTVICEGCVEKAGGIASSLGFTDAPQLEGG